MGRPNLCTINVVWQSAQLSAELQYQDLEPRDACTTTEVQLGPYCLLCLAVDVQGLRICPHHLPLESLLAGKMGECTLILTCFMAVASQEVTTGCPGGNGLLLLDLVAAPGRGGGDLFHRCGSHDAIYSESVIQRLTFPLLL